MEYVRQIVKFQVMTFVVCIGINQRRASEWEKGIVWIGEEMLAL